MLRWSGWISELVSIVVPIGPSLEKLKVQHFFLEYGGVEVIRKQDTKQNKRTENIYYNTKIVVQY